MYNNNGITNVYHQLTFHPPGEACLAASHRGVPGFSTAEEFTSCQAIA